MKRLILILAALAAMAGVAQAQTLTLVGPATARPGQTIAVNVALASPSADLAAMQWSIGLPANYTAAKAAAGAASTAAGKSLYCNAAWTNCLVVGVNTSVYAAGVVATYSIAVPSTAVPDRLPSPCRGRLR